MEKIGVNMCKNIFGGNLKAARRKRGMTQAQLADTLNISASTVGMYEQGRREPDNMLLSKICITLNVSTDHLLGFDKLKDSTKREVDEVINEFITTLERQPNLTYDGKPIEEEDREKIVAAIRIAATVAVSYKKKVKKKK